MILVDATQVYMRALFSLQNDHKDVPENKIRERILHILLGVRNQFAKKYGELLLIGDGQRVWRKDFYPHYKSSRKKKRKSSDVDWNLYFQYFNKIHNELEAVFPYICIRHQMAEGDDVIGIMANHLAPSNTMIISSDHDFIQLQVLPNVKQYDAGRRKYVTSDNPARHLVEKIFKGDAGDGVPNILSPDDIFLQDGVRQKPVTQKKINDWIENGIPNELQANYDRNQILVDLAETPEEIVEDVLKKFEAGTSGDRKNILPYILGHKLKSLLEFVNDF